MMDALQQLRQYGLYITSWEPAHIRRLFVYSLAYLLYLAQVTKSRYFTVKYAYFKRFCRRKLRVELRNKDSSVFWFVLFYFFSDCIIGKEKDKNSKTNKCGRGWYIKALIDVEKLRNSLKYFQLNL